MKTAIIDMGTNTFHLLVAERVDKQWVFLRNDKVPVKLGMGGINEGRITDEAMLRAINTMKDFRSHAKEAGVDKIRAIATSAVRSASNGTALVKRIQEETGIAVEVISGQQEAEFIWYGVKSAVNLGDETGLIVDIGGGSVEFIISKGQKMLWKQSYEIGGQRMLEVFHQTDPMSASSILDLKAWLDGKLKSLILALHEFHPTVLVGSSGTFDTLAEIDSRECDAPVNTDEIRHYSLSIEAYRRLHHSIVSKNREERLKIPGMIALRVDMIVVALVLIEWILSHFNPRSIEVSTWALKEGVLLKGDNS